MMRISCILKRKVKTVADTDSVLSAVSVMNRHRIGCVVVLRRKEAAGIITERDILRRIVAAGRSAKKTKCRDIMSKPLIAIESHEHIEDAIEIMIRKKIKKLIVLKEGRLAGIVTATDILGSGENIEYAALKKLAEFFSMYEPVSQAG